MSRCEEGGQHYEDETKSRLKNIAHLEQHDQSIGDCDRDGHDKDDVVDDEDLEKTKWHKDSNPPISTWLAFTL